ncbi:hypothetical protein [Draconibacterium orientale]|uniref:hypothetical protein n=1 Tax=Draconibacterium orientale TaxID=1168034 RepID=UPI0029C0A997|nr:hypothetical protein [Draconibacterium orientale]
MKDVVIGINSVIVGSVVIGENTIVRIGAIVTKDIEAQVTVVGNNKLLKSF